MKEPKPETITELKRLMGYRPAETCKTCRMYKVIAPGPTLDNHKLVCRLNPALKFPLDQGHTCDYHTPIVPTVTMSVDEFTAKNRIINYMPTGKEMTNYTEIPGDTPKTEQLDEQAPEIDYPEFTGQGLRKWRKSIGLTQAELGAELGYASSTIGNAETDNHCPLSGNMMARIRAYVDGKK